MSAYKTPASPRQVEMVLRLIAEGWSLKQIADEYRLSLRCVRWLAQQKVSL